MRNSRRNFLLLVPLAALSVVGCVMDNPKDGSHIGGIYSSFHVNGRMGHYKPGARVRVQARNKFTGVWETVSDVPVSNVGVAKAFPWQSLNLVLWNTNHWDVAGVNLRKARLRAVYFEPGVVNDEPLYITDAAGKFVDKKEVTIYANVY